MFGPEFIQRHIAQPMDTDFNAAVMTMANLTNPHGWDLTDSYVLGVPTCLADINRYVNEHGKTLQFNSDEPTVFACPEHAAAFMAWHHAAHYRTQLPFNIAGEAGVAYVQIRELLAQYGHDAHIESWAAYILTDILGRALFNAQYGEFPLDRREFMYTSSHRWAPLAARICIELADDKATERKAILLARETWGKA